MAMSTLELLLALSANSINPLDDILNEDVMIRKGAGIKIAEGLIEYITRKCLGCSSACGLSTGGNNQGRALRCR